LTQPGRCLESHNGRPQLQKSGVSSVSLKSRAQSSADQGGEVAGAVEEDGTLGVGLGRWWAKSNSAFSRFIASMTSKRGSLGGTVGLGEGVVALEEAGEAPCARWDTCG